MERRPDTRAAQGRAPGALLVVLALPVLAACGGVIQFEDRAAIGIGSPPAPAAPPPPAPAPEKRVTLEGDRITIKEKILFAYNDDDILPESFGLLEEIAKVIKENPHVKKIEVGGHASTEGDDAKNMDLSRRRANAVVQHLVSKGGVAKERLAAKGYGETKPLVKPDETDTQREINRRVEFIVLEQNVKAEAAK
jgi:outer membrane protein OmpA-like peptidoglycan-associated protein